MDTPSSTELLVGTTVVIVLAVVKWALDQLSEWLHRSQQMENSREIARIAAFGLILYSIMQDLHHPDRLLWLYWLLLCCWFYINNHKQEDKTSQS